MTGKREYGDYQTPISFAEKICGYLISEKKINPSVVIEPTCGIGNFLECSLSFNADEYYGIEINPEYCTYCKNRIPDERVKIINDDFFSFILKGLTQNTADTLVIGNPPWVTNSSLSSLGSSNIPVKTNFKKLKGLDAITGASNFDICEFIILKLIHDFRDTSTVIAMLCKMSVARNIFKEVKRNNISFEYFNILEFDANKVFGINTCACILVIKLSNKYHTNDICHVYSIEDYKNIKYSFGYLNGRFVSNIQMQNYDFDGICCLKWRQGIKHDCSKIMELSIQDGILYNGKKEAVDIEDTILFPLIKSSMIKKPVINSFSKYVLVTQKKVREKTEYLQKLVPKTWNYLNNNIELFNARKSTIYHDAPPFSMFGVGDYSYMKFKVAISGFYKKPLFSLLYDVNQKPVMTDDTCYFICFDNYEMAYVAMLLLNSTPVQEFLLSIAFLDAKRPYTKKILERLCFTKIFSVISYQILQETEKHLGLDHYITEDMYTLFQSSPVFQRTEQLKLC